MAFLRGYLNAEFCLVFNEDSLKLLMLELCARRENEPAEKGGNPKQRSAGVKLQTIS